MKTNSTTEIKLFEQQKVRTHWDDKEEKWYFSIIDVIEILSGSPRPRKYWNALKTKLKQEGSELSHNLGQLKMPAEDGKLRMADVADIEQRLRLIQSIPSPKAEPFKIWLAKTGCERMKEIADPEQGLERARENWQKQGRSEKWIQQRMSGQETRNKLTDYWKENGVEKTDEFSYLTNLIHTEWAGLSVRQHKSLKGLKAQNLRDHMSEAELIFTALAELSTRQIAETEEAKGVKENATAGKKRRQNSQRRQACLEIKTGKKVISGEKFLPPAMQKKKITG